jgi:hypothetical protein
LSEDWSVAAVVAVELESALGPELELQPVTVAANTAVVRIVAITLLAFFIDIPPN